MKRFMALGAFVALVSVIGFVSSTPAAPSYGKAKGYEGTISAVGGSGFTMTSNGKDGKTYKVQCDRTTQFMSGKDKADPSIIKPGIKVSVQGGQSGADIIMANIVTVMGDHKSK